MMPVNTCLLRDSCPVLLLAFIVMSGCNVASTGHNVQGKRLFEQGQFAEALSTFQKAAQANPRNADAYYNMGATYYYLGKQHKNNQWLAQADQLFRQALNANPVHSDTYRGLSALLVESGRSNDAFQMLQNWRARAPGSVDPVVELARLYKEKGDRNQSIQLLADALNINSNDARALKAMAQMREEAGQYQLALQNYIRSYQANNLQTDVAARIAALQGQTRTAVQPNTFQPGQPQLGSVNQYVPR